MEFGRIRLYEIFNFVHSDPTLGSEPFMESLLKDVEVNQIYTKS